MASEEWGRGESSSKVSMLKIISMHVNLPIVFDSEPFS